MFRMILIYKYDVMGMQSKMLLDSDPALRVIGETDK